MDIKYKQQYNDIYDIFNTFEVLDILLAINHVTKFNEKNKNIDITSNQFNKNDEPIKHLISLILLCSGSTYPLDAVIWMLGNYYFENMRCPVWKNI